jgi:SnoaL-like domain
MLAKAIKIAGFSLSVAAAAGLGSPLQAAGTTHTDDARAGIQLTMDTVDAMVTKGAPVKDIAAAFYDNDLMVVGEGEEHLYINLASFISRLEFFLKNGGKCSIKLVDPIRHSGNLAVAFAAEHCVAADAAATASDARVLYVFRKGSKGWRVTMEMFGSGAV